MKLIEPQKFVKLIHAGNVFQRKKQEKTIKPEGKESTVEQKGNIQTTFRYAGKEQERRETKLSTKSTDKDHQE